MRFVQIIFWLVFAFTINAQSRYGIQEYKNVSEFQTALFPIAKENDNVFIESLNAYYNYKSTSTVSQDTIFVIKQNAYNGRWHRVGNDPFVLVLNNDVTNSTVTMSPINPLTINLSVGRYRIEFEPLYNVNATTTGTGWNFQGGTAVITNYSFRSVLPRTASAIYVNNYSSKSQNFTTPQTGRITDNRGSIIIDFLVTTGGTLIPHFRSERAGALVTLRSGSILKLYKYN